MLKSFDDIQKMSKDNLDASVKSFGAMSKGVQAIASEVTDYAKKSFDEGTATLDKLLGAKTPEKAIEVQTAFFKSAYEGFVSEASKLGELYVDLATETYKPFEGYFGKAASAK